MESIKQTVAKGEGETPLNDPLAELYQSFNDTIAANPEMTFDEMRRVIDHCADVAEEPRGVDYIEDSFAGSRAMWLLPKTLKSNLTLLCLHGGGYVVGSMYSHRKMFGHFAKRLGARALVLDYRLAPESPHPGPVNEASRAYRWLLEDNKLNAADIAFIGDSAGGSLAITTMLRAREEGLPLPSAAICLSPWFDPEGAGASFETARGFDKIVSKESIGQMASLVAGPDGDLRDPLLRPLDLDRLRGLPPVLLQVSDSEALLDDSRLFFDIASKAGVDVSLQTYPRMQHVFHYMAGRHPEADRAIDNACDWLSARRA